MPGRAISGRRVHSLGNSLPTLANLADGERLGQIRKSYATGPEDRSLRIVERDIDLGEDGRFVVRVAGPGDEIGAAQSRFTVALVLTFLALGVALGLSTLLQIRFGLKPLIELSSAVADVRRGRSERIAGQYPGDIAPLAGELNLLLEANREILERARTQVGNLAHALKTPLSVIVNEAEGSKGELAMQVREQATVMRDQVDYYLNRARAAALAATLGVADRGRADPRGARSHLREDLPRRWGVDHRDVRRKAMLPRRAPGFRGDGRQSRRQRLQVGGVARRGDGVDLRRS